MDLKKIKRKVFRPHRDRFLKIVPPVIEALSRQPSDQIETDILKARFSQQSKRISCIIRIVTSRKQFQIVVIERLDSKTRTIDAVAAIGGKGLCGNCRWIHLHRYLCTFSHLERRSNNVENPFNLICA